MKIVTSSAFLVYFSHTNAYNILPCGQKMGQFEGASTLRCALLYRMLLWLNQFLSALYHLYSRTYLIDLTLNLTHQRQMWHQKLLVKYTQNCI